MRIAFLLPCLEAGRTGVGDYVRGLARACRERGHESVLIALNDGFITDPVESMEESGGFRVELRLPAAFSWEQKHSRAAKLLQRFQPDWISLHYVPYGFHRKGFTPQLGAQVRALAGSTPVEIMFHEIWIGQHKHAQWKQRCWGWLQRWGVRSLLSGLRPKIIHTTNATYASLFALMGVKAGVLTMFGAIPFTGAAMDFGPGLPCLSRDHRIRAEWMVAGLFGTLHPEWQGEPLMSHLTEAARRMGRRLAFVSVGRIGRGEEIWKRLEQVYPRVHFALLGEQSIEAVSALFGAFDFGVAASPWSLIGKSSSVAAMLEHGLPVIVNRDDIHYSRVPRLESADPLLISMQSDLPDRICAGLPRRPPASRLPGVAEAFLQSLSASQSVPSTQRPASSSQREAA